MGISGVEAQGIMEIRLPLSMVSGIQRGHPMWILGHDDEYYVQTSINKNILSYSKRAHFLKPTPPLFLQQPPSLLPFPDYG